MAVLPLSGAIRLSRGDLVIETQTQDPWAKKLITQGTDKACADLDVQQIQALKMKWWGGIKKKIPIHNCCFSLFSAGSKTQYPNKTYSRKLNQIKPSQLPFFDITF